MSTENEIRKSVFDNFRNSILIAILVGIPFSPYLATNPTLSWVMWSVALVLWVFNVCQYYFEVLKPLKSRFVLAYCTHVPEGEREAKFDPIFRPVSFFVIGAFSTIIFELVWVILPLHTYDTRKRESGLLEEKVQGLSRNIDIALHLLCATKTTPTRPNHICDSKQSITAPTETLRLTCLNEKRVSVVQWVDPKYRGDIVVLIDHDVIRLTAEDSYHNKFVSLSENIKWERTNNGWSLSDVNLSTPVVSVCK